MSKSLRAQRGMFVIALVGALATIAFIFVLGYSSYYSKRTALTLLENQQAYLAEAKSRLLEAYAAHLDKVDGDSSQSYYRTGSNWLQLAGIAPKWNLQIAVSNRITKGDIMYTVVALWMPTDFDATNPPTFNASTGVFSSCTTAPCPPRAFTVLDGYGLQLEANNKVYEIMNAVAFKAQSYFKSRWLSDIEKDVSVNYFRAPRGGCVAGPDDIPCIDSFTDIRMTALPAVTGLDSMNTTNPWGLAIEVTNAAPAKSGSMPFTLAFRTRSPWGKEYSIFAVQPL